MNGAQKKRMQKEICQEFQLHKCIEYSVVVEGVWTVRDGVG